MADPGGASMADPGGAALAGSGAALGELAGRRVLVAGAGTAGASAARFLVAHGARVTVADARAEAGGALRADGVEVVDLGAAVARVDDERAGAGFDLVIVSPGFRPDSGVVVAARRARIAVWGEVELAWRVDRSQMLGPSRTWIVVTGTNGKTTTTSMVEAIVDAAGRTVAACGNIGLPVLDALVTRPRVDVLAVEMSSFQLHWAPSVVPDAGAVINIAQDHLDWHGSMPDYVAAKVGALRGAIAVVGGDDPIAGSLSATRPGARTVRTRLGDPDVGEVGFVDAAEPGGDVLTDRAFADEGRPIVAADAIRPAGPSGRADAAVAAALCLAIGVGADAIAAGLRGFAPGRHRGEVVARLGDLVFVDDSKATNPHAAAASIRAHRRVVLVAGGQLKGASVDDLARENVDLLAGVVAIGADRDVVVAAFARHAPGVPAVTVFTGDDGRVTATSVESAAAAAQSTPVVDRSDELIVESSLPDDAAESVMNAAVAAAVRLAGRGDAGAVDAVLLAPAAASLDMFDGYGARGDAFAAAAIRIGADAVGATASDEIDR